MRRMGLKSSDVSLEKDMGGQNNSICNSLTPLLGLLPAVITLPSGKSIALA
jgi:hypothetical protein